MTIKSKADLTSQIASSLADNTTRAITEALLRTMFTDLLDSVHSVYGSILVRNGSTPQSLNTTYAKLTGFAADGNAAGTTPAHASDQITVGTAGEYEFEVGLNASGVATTTYDITIAKNGTTQEASFEAEYLTTGTELFTVVLHGTITLAASDIVTVYGKSSNGAGANLTIKNGSLVLKRIA